MASPLEAFVLTFALEGDEIVAKGLARLTGDADKLAKALGGSDKALSSTETGAKKTGKAVKVTAENFMQLTRKVVVAAAPLLALGVVLHQTLNFARQGEELLFMAQSANTAAGSFQRLANATRMFGGTPQSTAGILAGLNAQIQNMRFGEGSAIQEASIRYGFRLHGENGLATPEELLENVARRFETLDTASQLDLGRMIGLDEPTIRLLQGGVKSLRQELELAAKYTVFSGKDLENARRFERTLREVKMGFTALWAEIARALLPALQYVGENIIKIIDYFRRHADFIKGALGAVSAVLTAIAIKALVAFAPFYGAVAVIGALAAAIALLYDDFMTFANGGESALSPLWRMLVNFGKWWQDLPGWIQDALSALKEFLNPLSAVTRVLDAFGKVKDIFSGEKRDAETSNGESEINPRQKSIHPLSFARNPIAGMIEAQRVLSQAESHPLNSVGKGDISNTVNNSSRNVTVENNITVNGSANPQETAQAVSNEINPIFQMATGAL